MMGMIGKTVTVTVERPLGSCHPEHKDIYYSVNYGYIRGNQLYQGANSGYGSFSGTVFSVGD